jgi:hypothetical protein
MRSILPIRDLFEIAYLAKKNMDVKRAWAYRGWCWACWAKGLRKKKEKKKKKKKKKPLLG